jgi:RHS repeat-associated protein
MTPGIVAESDLAGTLKSEYVFFDGERVARKDFPGNTVAYYFSDHLKTASVITDSTGTIKADSDYYPWGGELQFVNNDSNHFKYGGHEHDSESNLEYYGARYYGNGLSRFITPDWSAAPVPVPYADLNNPQTLNQYAYVHNNPMSYGDPDGHCCDLQYAWDFGAGAVRGVVSSASFGLVGAPKAGDSQASLLGQSYGTFVEGMVGAGVMSKGAGDAGAGLVLAPETGGASLVVSGGGLVEMGAGAVMEAGATKNAAAIMMVAKNSGSGGTNSSQDRTSADELRRDANGRAVPDPEAKGNPHTQLGTRQSKSRPGTSYRQAREFDANGKPVKDIDFTDHGRPQNHPNPHQHTYDSQTGKRNKKAEPVK